MPIAKKLTRGDQAQETTSANPTKRSEPRPMNSRPLPSPSATLMKQREEERSQMVTVRQ